MSLRWRIALSMGVITACVVSLAAAGAYVATERQLRESLDESLNASVAGVGLAGSDRDRRVGEVDGAEPPVDPARACPLPGLLQPASAAQIVSADGEVTACLEGGVVIPVGADVVALAEAGGSARFDTVSIGGDDYRVLTVARPDGGVLQVARDMSEVSSVLASLRVWFGLLAVVGVLVSALLGWLVARKIVRPVDRLRDAAETIAVTNDLSTPIDVEGTGEVASLAASFSTMVGALAVSREQQQRLIDDASHEMRTPLTSLRTNLEVAGRLDQLPVDDRRDVLDAIVVDVDELTNLLTELVELATDRTDGEPTERVSLADIARGVAEVSSRRSSRQVVVVDDTTGTDDEVDGRPAELDRAVANLVENALKYSPPDSSVEVVVEGCRLEVRDHGPGIDPADRPKVFDRFFRATAARTEPGSGLGLAIVKAIVERHGGTVFVGEVPDGGAAVGFELPPAGVGSISEQVASR